MKSPLLLFLLATIGVNTLTYTCNEVKKLIHDQSQIVARTACVALDENISYVHGFAAHVYLVAVGTKDRYSLAQAAAITSGCVHTFGNVWSIEVEKGMNGDNIDCSYEFTILFASIDTYTLTAYNNAQFYSFFNGYNLTVVSPSGGLLVDFSCANAKEPFTFYTGFGSGAAEQMYYYGSSLCDEHLSIYAWDTAVTINAPQSGDVTLTYWATPHLSVGSVSHDVLLMGSGKSSNLIQHGRTDKFIKLTSSGNEDLKFHIDGIVELDHKLDNSLVFSSQCTDHRCTPSDIQMADGDVHLILAGDILMVNYTTKVPDGQLKDDDLFFMRIATTPMSSTEAPTTQPVKPNSDYSCGCDTTNGVSEFVSDLWLDVVFIVDVSTTMGIEKMNTVSSMLNSIVSSMTLKSSGKEQYSRVGLVTVSSEAVIVSNFTTPFPSPLNLQMSQSKEAYISSSGVSAAMEIFSHSIRRSAQQVMYIIASTDSGLPNSVPIGFKNTSGIIALTDAAPGTWKLPRDLISPGYYNTLLDNNANERLLCEINCFCPKWFSKFWSGDEYPENPDRGCFLPRGTNDAFELAKKTCQDDGLLMTTIHDDAMQQFLLSLVSQELGMKKPYWIGYEYNGTNFEWIDDSTSSYSKWASGQPDLNAGRCVYSQQTTGLNSGWFTDDCTVDHSFVCGIAPCSVKKFCDQR